MEIVEKLIAQDIRAIARAITIIENDEAGKEQLIDEVYPHTGRARVWGITGPPGSGKSTLVNRLIQREREKGHSVAVVAVDPSSPFSGGAFLGDRLRMQKHADDPGVFIRSMATRGHLGGISPATGDTIKILDAAGFETILVETIGVGQSEIEVIQLTDIVLLVLVPGLGDEIQMMKAGIMEIGDVFVVNKKDIDGAERLKSEIEYVLAIQAPGSTPHPVALVSAKTDDGIDALLDTIYKYYEQLCENGCLEDKRKERVKKYITAIFSYKVHEMLDVHFELSKNLDTWINMIYRKEVKPYSFINDKIQTFLKECEEND